MKKYPLSIIIVTFNNEEHITECLSSLKKNTLTSEVIIIDNNSHDQTLHKIKKNPQITAPLHLTLIKNKTNRGFAQAVNQGLKKCRGDFICLLGPDCRIREKTMEYLADFLKKHPETGLVAPQLISNQGNIHSSCRHLPTLSDVILELTGLPTLFPHKIIPHWKKVNLAPPSAREVEQPEASCIMTHRNAFEHIGLMDEKFPIFFNDVDWCRRFLEKGYKIFYLPRAKALHYQGSSIYKNRIPMIWKSHQGFYRYFLKYSQNCGQKFLIHLMGLLLIYTAALRSILYIISEPLLRKFRN